MYELVQSIGEIISARNELARRAESQYAREVEEIMQAQCRDQQRIELLLDFILDFCFDSAMVRLYKKLCRYYFKIDPEATASYVNAYREMWDEQEDRPKGKGGSSVRSENILK